ncbi:putative pyridoxine 5'-phosphate oxidase superfamily flavin-nucleotide-binding protein [Methylohalomonas lacus]|uniref:Pyridoxine 5'-phosphate oxidase superfamily flavin-nucleotide-binding protein n=1 Tax=Methylohalomonas lacus TaxID=398773 RepID=A0AAE3HJT7_9GAMM|nr:pyridoxamine 5'-phosphate oxidase family protein [Methylohalomonas lacus]MCS3903666.1 putative pyridoxine 5'-phosphate oxidase superfamily flavin-nucleotide-binding protein [Methylohalomonas lacus]
MSRLYGDQHRAFQDSFDTRNMADRIEELAVVTEVSDDVRVFIEQRDMFFLSTVDQKGRPTVSYKGGAPGFVKVVDVHTLAFPSYDGNGMYFSMGNIAANDQVGMLFIDFEKPHRIRVQGTATVSKDDPLIDHWHEAELIVRVTISELWQNCPRYIHRYQKVQDSRYVPQSACETPIAEWKRTDAVQDVLKPDEQAAVEKSGGTISIEEWMECVQSGDDNV